MSRIVRMLAAAASAVLLALPASAQGPVPVEAAAGVPFALRLGGEAVIAGAEVRVRFDRVTDDSRCPADVVCVWAGMFAMALVVTSMEGVTLVETEIILDTLGGEGTVAGLHFTLLRVKPARYASVGSAEPLPYAVLLRADRVQ